jgi:hypothetical protein
LAVTFSTSVSVIGVEAQTGVFGAGLCEQVYPGGGKKDG